MMEHAAESLAAVGIPFQVNDITLSLGNTPAFRIVAGMIMDGDLEWL